MTACRIGKIKFKSGGELRLLPAGIDNFRRVSMSDWGEITFRCFDGQKINNETLIYMMEAAKDLIIRGECE